VLHVNEQLRDNLENEHFTCRITEEEFYKFPVKTITGDERPKTIDYENYKSWSAREQDVCGCYGIDGIEFCDKQFGIFSPQDDDLFTTAGREKKQRWRSQTDHTKVKCP